MIGQEKIAVPSGAAIFCIHALPTNILYTRVTYTFNDTNMTKFLALYMAPPAALDEMMKTMTPEISKSHNDSWATWMEKHKDAIADQGAMLGKNKRVNSAGITDARNEMTGYMIIQAESAEAAAAVMSDNPMLQMPEAYVEVTEIRPMQG